MSPNRDQVHRQIELTGIIPSIRVSSTKDAVFAAEAVADTGIPIVEITMTVPGAVELITKLRDANAELVVGAGTVWDVEMARRCVDAGAFFLTSPGTDVQTIEFANKNDLVVFPGAFSTTEVIEAWKMGVDFVKIFPSSLLGPAYFRALKAPFPEIKLIASGGVTQATARDFIASGAAALEIGGELIPHHAIESRNSSWIQELARRFTGMVRQGRSEA